MKFPAPAQNLFRKPLAVASVVFFMAIMAAAGVIRQLETYRVQDHRAEVSVLAADQAANLQRHLDQTFSATYALAVLVRQGKGTVNDFDEAARAMLPLYPGVSAMQLAPDGVVRQIFPLAGNEAAIGHDILNDPRRAQEGRLARDSDKLTLAGPFDLKQGGVGAVARLPVYLDDRNGHRTFWGFTNVMIRFPQALEQSHLSQLPRRGYAYQLWRINPDSGKKQVIAEAGPSHLQGAVQKLIHVPNGAWTLNVAPVGGWGSSGRLAVDAGLGLLFCLLLAWVAKLLVVSMNHETELEGLVQSRTAEIRESKERLRMLEDNLPDSYLYQYVNDGSAKPKFIYLSAGVEKLHGVSRDDALQDAMTLHCLIDEAQLPEMLNAEQVSFQNMTDFTAEVRMRRTDGEWRWVQLRSRPTRKPDGRVVWDGVALDITDRREAEAALRSERDFSEILLNSLPGVFYLYDEQLTFRRWNPNLEKVLGYSAMEIASMSPLDFFTGDDRKLVGKAIQKVFSTGEGEVEADLVSRDGTRTPYYFTGQRTHIGEDTCLVGVGVDITERKRLEQQLFHSQKMEAIGQLAGGVAHDLNNILQVITGYSSVLTITGGLQPRQQEAARQIAAATERASQLTRGLLAFSRKQVMDLRLLDLNEIVRHVEMFLTRIIGEDIRLKIVCHGSPLPVRVDGSQIEQILMNLAANSRDAMPKGGELTLETSLKVLDAPFEHAHGYGKPGRYALLVVSDSGCGMDEKTRTKLFEPFFTTKEVGKGTGLGMAIVYGIVKQHNGYINVYTEPGHGSVFRIYLPLVEGEEAGAEEAVEVVQPEGGSETILLVEDDPDVRDLMVTLLTEFGYNVINAVDGQDAVAKFSAHRDEIRLILMDLIMPRKNGIEAYQEISRIQPGVKVLYSSGYTSDFIQSRGVTNDAIELIMKPVQPTELMRKVREMLDS